MAYRTGRDSHFLVAADPAAGPAGFAIRLNLFRRPKVRLRSFNVGARPCHLSLMPLC